MSLVHLAKKKTNFFQLSAEVMKSLDILKNETDVLYATCLNIFLFHLCENITHFSTVQKNLSLSPLATIKDMHFTLYVYIYLVRLSENITHFSTVQKNLSLSPLHTIKDMHFTLYVTNL